MIMHLIRRNRILRHSPAIRAMVAETILKPSDFIAPLFITEGYGVKEEIPSMTGYYRRSIDFTVQEVKELSKLGIKSVLLFIKCKDELKDNKGTEALNPDGLMQRSIKAIKDACPDIVVMTDVALDPFSTYGHDGIVEGNEIVNDPTVEVLAKMSVSHAQAGADIVAPSDMMDGRILAIREALEQNGLTKTGIMAYSAKYASCFYGPFRDALDSAPGFGDKKTYQRDYANRREVRDSVDVPVSAYHVSGEYAMIKAAAKMGWLDENKAIIESLTSIKRAGADLIATYFAKDAALLMAQ